MKCKNHPDRETIAVCQQYERGFCLEWCECFTIEDCCECIDPKVYCKFRTQCGIWEMSRDRRKRAAVTAEDAGIEARSSDIQYQLTSLDTSFDNDKH